MTKIKSKFTETSGSTGVVESQVAAMNLAVADTREGLNQETQDNLVTVATYILQTPEAQSEKAKKSAFFQASQKAEAIDAMNEETLVANALNPEGFPADVQEIILQDPTAFLDGQKTAVKDNLKTELAKVSSQGAQTIAVSKVNQLLDKSGASADPILVQELKQQIAKRAKIDVAILNSAAKNGQSKPTTTMGSGRL